MLTHSSHKQSAKPKHAKKGTPEYSLVESIHASEKRILGDQHSAHAFEVGLDNAVHEQSTLIGSLQVTLEPSSFTDEKYELFNTYQKSVHQDDTTPDGFTRFLVESPLRVGPLLLR